MYSLYMSRMNKTHCGLFARMRLNYPISKGFPGTILGGMQNQHFPLQIEKPSVDSTTQTLPFSVRYAGVGATVAKHTAHSCCWAAFWTIGRSFTKVFGFFQLI